MDNGINLQSADEYSAPSNGIVIGTSNISDTFYLGNVSGYRAYLDMNNMTGDKYYGFPNSSGTLAIKELSAKVDKLESQNKQLLKQLGSTGK